VPRRASAAHATPVPRTRYGLRGRVPSLAFVFGVALLAPAQDAKSPLDKIDPAKLPASFRPGKALPKEVIAVLGARGDKVDCCAFRDDGKFLATSGPDQIIRVWNLAEMRFVGGYRQPTAVVCITYTPDRKTLITGDENGTVRLLSAEGMLRTTLAAHKDGPAFAVAVSADGKKLATGGRDKAIKVWDISKAKVPAPTVLTGHTNPVLALAFAPSGDSLVSVADEQMRLWDTSGEKAKAGAVATLGGKARSVAISPDGKKIVTAGSPETNRVWEFNDGKPEKPVPFNTDGRGAFSAVFSPDGSTIACAAFLPNSSEGEERILVTTEGEKKHDVRTGLHVHKVAFAPDGRHLAAVTESGTLLVRLPK
jgi:WD40 repeat protein